MWTIEESYEGMQVWGDIGSGKSSTIARVTAAAMLRAGYGGLVLNVKPEDTDEWRRNLAENGRMEDGVFFGADGGCFNFLAYELAHGARLKVGSKNATRILTELVNMAQHDAAGGDPFWKQSARSAHRSHAGDLIVAAGATPNMLLAKEIIQSGPNSRNQAKDVQWQAQSKCWELIEAGRHGHANGSHDFRMAETYWLPGLSSAARKKPPKHCRHVQRRRGASFLHRPHAPDVRRRHRPSARTTFFGARS